MVRLTRPGLVEVTHQSGQIHLALSCLKAAFHCSLRQFLELIRARALKKEIRIATNVLSGRKRDCVHPLFDNSVAGSWKLCDPMRQRADEIVDLISRRASIDLGT